MNRRDINIFGTSFLDLLSGALAAVIILFILVPKMTRENVDLLEKVKEIQVVAENVDDLLHKIRNSVPKELLETIQEEMDQLKSQVKQLQRKLTELENKIKTVAEERDRWENLAKEQQEEMLRLKKRITELEIKVHEAKEKSKMANTVEKTLGVFARFGILCKWSETDADVDIGVQRFGSLPEHCWRMYPSKKWGILGEDVRERVDDEHERFELFYVPQIYADEYTFWVSVYTGSIGTVADVNCILIFHPGKPDEVRREIGPVHVTKERNVCIASFRLSETGFELIPLREPIWGSGKVIK